MWKSNVTKIYIKIKINLSMLVNKLKIAQKLTYWERERNISRAIYRKTNPIRTMFDLLKVFQTTEKASDKWLKRRSIVAAHINPTTDACSIHKSSKGTSAPPAHISLLFSSYADQVRFTNIVLKAREVLSIGYACFVDNILKLKKIHTEKRVIVSFVFHSKTFHFTWK